MFKKSTATLDSQSKVYSTAVRMLSQRDYSQQNLADKLLQRGASSDHVTSVIDTCIKEGWLDDERYCERFIAARVASGMGKMRILRDAAQKGIPKNIVETCLNCTEIDWFQSALTAYNRKFSGISVTDYKDKAKCMRYLQYRGFSFDEINYAIEQAAQEQTNDEAPFSW
ncbi:regulatory protein RecX [Flocculibacter collagenilyticus]|uniref:regulatory protein RecX n=1 Tax=Flocculibacter collagenilyticus TaxID=2744479 RepID=UPI0018F64A8D|nr:regulatory protein RecX [Flocculibacter collagenilyticus]